ncbi:MAG TPA: hypothetical protein VF474_04415 [Phenylobacterium sp.]
MKLELAVIAAVMLAAGPAAAEFGSNAPKNRWGPTGTAASRPPASYGVPAPAATPAYGGSTTARIYGPPATPKAEPFKPYEPYKPASVFGADRRKKP